MKWGGMTLALAAVLLATPVFAQSPQPSPPRTSPQVPRVTMQMLAGQGFEIKSMQRISERALQFAVLMQRAGDIRTCLMRITYDAARNPRQESLCF